MSARCEPKALDTRELFFFSWLVCALAAAPSDWVEASQGNMEAARKLAKQVLQSRLLLISAGCIV